MTTTTEAPCRRSGEEAAGGANVPRGPAVTTPATRGVLSAIDDATARAALLAALYAGASGDELSAAWRQRTHPTPKEHSR